MRWTAPLRSDLLSARKNRPQNLAVPAPGSPRATADFAPGVGLLPAAEPGVGPLPCAGLAVRQNLFAAPGVPRARPPIFDIPRSPAGVFRGLVSPRAAMRSPVAARQFDWSALR